MADALSRSADYRVLRRLMPRLPFTSSPGLDTRTAVLLAARLCGFKDWYTYLRRDLDDPLSLLDYDLSDEDFAARDAFQMAVLQAAGLGAVARELLDRANPTGSWAQQPFEEPVRKAFAGNEPL
jgi:hypothetical protein